MVGHLEITPRYWAGFIVLIILFLLADLGIFHREARKISFKEAVGWTVLWFAFSMLLAGALAYARGRQEGLEFVTGYVIELSLSMDNVFVIALIFAYFRVPIEYQHRVLFWGILGALLMRGLMIWGGVTLVRHFHWILYVLGFFLVLSGIKMLFGGEETVEPEQNIVIRLARKLFPVSLEFAGQKFFTRIHGKLALTPLTLVLLMVETTDLVFAVDSLPAIFAVTERPFIIFSSNICAILGLRSLYFVLAGALDFFHYLKLGLSTVLLFIGLKMLAAFVDLKIPSGLALAIVVGIIALSIIASLIKSAWDRHVAAQCQPDVLPPVQSAALSHHEPLSRSLTRLVESSADGDHLTLNRLLERTEGRGLYLIIILLCLPFITPIPLPGYSVIIGAVMMLLALREALGFPPKLPRFMGDRPIPLPQQRRILEASLKVLRFIEKWAKPRGKYWVTLGVAQRGNALVVALMGAILALPLPIPLTNTLPAIAVILVLASMMEEDGWLIWAGYFMAIVSVGYILLIAGTVVVLFHRYWDQTVHFLHLN